MQETRNRRLSDEDFVTAYCKASSVASLAETLGCKQSSVHNRLSRLRRNHPDVILPRKSAVQTDEAREKLRQEKAERLKSIIASFSPSL